MTSSRKLHIGMSLAPTWLSGDAWRRGDSGVEGLFSPHYYVDIAQRSEAAKLDFVFRPDTLFLDAARLEDSPGFASLDPTILLAAIAGATSRIGLLSTVSTTFLPPYVIARQIQSLNALSNGRAGWNIVTALDGNENFGLSDMPSSDERYARAKESVEIVRRLWEGFPGDALKLDRETGRYADPAAIRAIDFDGRFYKVRGPLNMPDMAEDPIPLIQAGASPTGRAFAASIADAVFAASPDRDAAIELRADLRNLAEASGRSADKIRVLPGLSLYLAESRGEALELYMETHKRLNRGQKFAAVKACIGLDLTDWPNDRPVTAEDLPEEPATVKNRTMAGLLRRLIVRDSPTPDELLKRPEVIGSAHWQIIGTVEDAIEGIRDWHDAGAIDGFIAVPGGSVSSMHLTLHELVPRLAEAGLFRSDYSGTSFYSHLTEE
ncbi:NtaA/DmoA family FMN-dependent monooxygenase [Roseibium aggregatum]|uniref:NtaA/DmoA family FMN-dependent monooxygenase n=1 Tax=Roseibium aggregatum TaxID=187304 RepID=A0A939EGY0_9HYPH|nr:NtaA/DmoA family FMN-dependent monooxygenase [Roseibium aggregatum]MBN9672262.1 NtaA/DmoA family FMN-dependent monooxygenase [Roseibium aggregatum]